MQPTRIDGGDMRILVREGTKRRSAFAFGLDGSGDPVLLIQPGNKPEKLKPHVKKEGVRPPIVLGTLTVRSDVMEMICEQAPSKGVTSLKRFLRANKPKVNVVFVDDGGNMLDSLKPESSANDDGVTTLDEVNVTGIDPKLVKPLLQRAKRLQPRIARAPGPLERKLKRGLSKALAHINEARLEEAQTLITVIEQAVARIGVDRENADKSMARADKSARGRKLGADVARAKALRKSIARSPGGRRNKLDKAVRIAARLLKQRDFDRARVVMDRIEKALGAVV